MKFQPDQAQGVHQITRTGSQGVWVDGQAHTGSLVVPWVGQVVPWRPGRFEALDPACFAELLQWRPEVVIFGSGARLRFVAPALTCALTEARIGVETMDTPAACRTFNVLASEGRSVLAALICAA